jgi:serine phosphatase RsbU (regulator of sigma subunit)
MIARLFIRIYEGISFTCALALFSTTWSWVASFYGFYIVYATVNFTSAEWKFVIIALVLCTGVAIIIHLIHFGLFHRIGFSGFTRSIQVVNKLFQRKHVFKNYKTMDSEEIEELYHSITSLPKENLFAALGYTVLVISFLVIIVYFRGSPIDKILYVFFGGLFAALIIGYFTFLITEYFIGPYRVRVEQILHEKSRTVKTKNMLSFKYKSVFMLLLIFFSMVILTILIQRSEKPILQITIFILLSILAISILIFMMINTINISLNSINRATKKLAAGGGGLFYSPFYDREFITFAEHYNRAAGEINDIRQDLERKVSERTRELSEAYERLNSVYSQIQADLNMATRVQKRIMHTDLDGIEGMRLAIHYYPMADIGGDIYDVYQLFPGYIRVFLADAIGHGIQAALITMIIKGEYEKVKYNKSLSKLVESLNESFIELYYTLNAFFSCILIDIDTKNKKTYFASAGHPDQLHIHGGKIELLRHTGKLIGVMNETKYDRVAKEIHSGDKILLFTDGLFEQHNEKDEVFGYKRIRDIVEENISLELEELQDKILVSIKEYVDAGEEIAGSDDITLIGIEIL